MAEDSGFSELQEDYGFFATLYALTGGDITKQKQILAMPLGKVYYFIQYQARLNEAKKLYWEFKRKREEIRRGK